MFHMKLPSHWDVAIALLPSGRTEFTITQPKSSKTTRFTLDEKVKWTMVTNDSAYITLVAGEDASHSQLMAYFRFHCVVKLEHTDSSVTEDEESGPALCPSL
ncbi:hypothetical protein AURDEDRAFT_160538 [Auricularia subglabra TFB-10046 SS5]|nr:hypothetical protein AURDEDRAFT_160538 [Auricularia subglabra TFB-10046 SS5]